MARSWVGLTIVAGLPCMVPLRWTVARDSYANYSLREKYYQPGAVSSQMVCQIRPPPQLLHKGCFPYECMLWHACTCCATILTVWKTVCHRGKDYITAPAP